MPNRMGSRDKSWGEKKAERMKLDDNTLKTS